MENWRAERAWQSFRLFLNARGHLFEPPEPTEPRLADDQNFLQAPMVSSWFNPDRIPLKVEPPNLIQLTRSGDAELAGSWSQVKPADLQEWRRFFQGPTAAETNSLPESPADEVVPLIVIDGVPLVDAIRNLPRQAKFKIRFDPGLFPSAGESQPAWQPKVSFRFEIITARKALDAVLENYDLMLQSDPGTGSRIVSRALAPPSGWPHEFVDLENDPLPPWADEVQPLVTIDGVPAADAVRNIARRFGINIQFEEGALVGSLPSRNSLDLVNVTSRQLLAKVLADHGLALKSSAHSPIYRVIRYRGPTTIQPDNTAAGVLASLADYEEELRALYAASERPGCQPEKPVRRRYTDWKAAPNYRGFSKVSQALTLHASAHLALAHPEVALRDATALARMAEALRNRRDVFGAMIRVAVSAQYLQVVWEGLAARRWNEGQLRTL